jgi:hypothetical protein
LKTEVGEDSVEISQEFPICLERKTIFFPSSQADRLAKNQQAEAKNQQAEATTH